MTIVACTTLHKPTDGRFNALIYCVAKGALQAKDLRQGTSSYFVLIDCSRRKKYSGGSSEV